MSRSESLKRYWRYIKEEATRTGATIAQTRTTYKGIIIPKEERIHIYGDKYYYIVRPKGNSSKGHVTIRSDRAMTSSQIRQAATKFYNAKKEEYDEEDGKYWNEDELIVQGGSRNIMYEDGEWAEEV